MGVEWGISAGGHDAALAVLVDGRIEWASHSERHSGLKNDQYIDDGLIDAALVFGIPDAIVWHEKPLLKRTREIYAGQFSDAFGHGPRGFIGKAVPGSVPIRTVGHHHSHAAGGYYTSGFDRAAVLVVDAVGEWDATTLWEGRGDDLRCVARARYPNSLGLFYTAMTDRCGFKPNEEEYIMMGLAAYGDPLAYRDLVTDELVEVTDEWPFYRCRINMHRGIGWWRREITDSAGLAAAAQSVFTEIMVRLARHARDTIGGNLVLSGGCALNCVANSELARIPGWDGMWIMPNPGDAGNSLGAVLAYRGRHATWRSPYLGTNIPGAYPIDRLLGVLSAGGIAGVANGRAEFGPRALGNRSLLGDPRDPGIKDKMNTAKKRELFRPFAPVIKAESVSDYFHVEDMGVGMADHMQFVVHCKDPDRFPGISHVDGTSRVQTVTRQQHGGLYELLDRWDRISGCPMLVNTSLNIKGKPLVDDEEDAREFESTYGIPVFTHA
jgi:carbamoyltransferase